MLNLFKMLLVNATCEWIHLKNGYLINEENYNKLRNLLGKANITFKWADALALNKTFKREYDFILLSNIADYFSHKLGLEWNYAALKQETAKMKVLLKEDGILAIGYIIRYSYSLPFLPLFMRSNLFVSDLTDEEIIVFSNAIDKSFGNDALLLERKKSGK